MSEYHEMKIGLHSEKATELYCPMCGRHIRFERTPEHRMIVLTNGDPLARHTVNTEGRTIRRQGE